MSAIRIVQRGDDPRFPFRISIEQNGGVLFAVRAKAACPGAILNELPDGFEIALLHKRFPDAKPVRIKRVLDQLRNEGRMRAEGHGRGTRWWRGAPTPG